MASERRTGDCECGIANAWHFDRRNRPLSCADTWKRYGDRAPREVTHTAKTSTREFPARASHMVKVDGPSKTRKAR